MAKYYVSTKAQSEGWYEVHAAGCHCMPPEENRLYLGNYINCEGAVAVAKKHYPEACCCKYCVGEHR